VVPRTASPSLMHCFVLCYTELHFLILALDWESKSPRFCFWLCVNCRSFKALCKICYSNFWFL